MKKTTKTIVKKYDGEGKLLEHTETTVEEIEENDNEDIPYTYTYIPSRVDSPTNVYTRTRKGESDSEVTYNKSK